MFFQQGGAPPLFNKKATDVLNRKFSEEQNWRGLNYRLATSFS
jgi:hypothetical protein